MKPKRRGRDPEGCFVKKKELWRKTRGQGELPNTVRHNKEGPGGRNGRKKMKKSRAEGIESSDPKTTSQSGANWG